jgi:hypothetical protein
LHEKDKENIEVIGWTFLTLVICYILFLRSFLMQWGSAKERSKYYVADSILLQPDCENTLAVTINKPSSAIWPWVAQMGLNKAGYTVLPGPKIFLVVNCIMQRGSVNRIKKRAEKK